MAFQLGDIKIRGTIEGFSFYHSVYGWLLRRKAGPSSKQFKTSPAFARARQNSAEFRACSKAASAIRQQLNTRAGICNKQLYHRLVRLMRLLANEDTTSPHGQRTPHKGMSSPAGQKLLQAFEIAPGQTLRDFLFPKRSTTRSKRRRPPQRRLRFLLRPFPNNNRSLPATAAPPARLTGAVDSSPQLRANTHPPNPVSAPRLRRGHFVWP